MKKVVILTAAILALGAGNLWAQQASFKISTGKSTFAASGGFVSKKSAPSHGPFLGKKKVPKTIGMVGVKVKAKKTTWIPGHYEQTQQKVYVPGHYEKIWVDIPCNHYAYGFPACKQCGYYKTVWVPAHYECKPVQIWVPGQWMKI